MVAEAVQEVVVEETQGITPETSEPTPEPVVEQEEDYTSVLAELVPDATEDAKDAPAVADSPEAALKDKTPEQLLELGEQRALAKLGQAQETTNQRNRETGLRNTLASSRKDLQDLLTPITSDPQVVLDAIAKLDQVHGAHIAIRDADVKNATEATVQAMRAALTEAGAKFTGLKDFEPGTSLDEYATKIAEHARKGYKSPTEVKDAVKDGQVALLKRLKAAGVEIPTERVPNVPEARAGGTRLPTFAAFDAMDISEQEKFTPEQRQRIYADDAARRARG